MTAGTVPVTNLTPGSERQPYSAAQLAEHNGGKWHVMRTKGELAPSRKPYDENAVHQLQGFQAVGFKAPAT
jgi:hypothetical protein